MYYACMNEKEKEKERRAYSDFKLSLFYSIAIKLVWLEKKEEGNKIQAACIVVQIEMGLVKRTTARKNIGKKRKQSKKNQEIDQSLFHLIDGARSARNKSHHFRLVVVVLHAKKRK